ncbi:MAG: PD-(D/E)XK nuclease family protein, partial [Oscillospiraceae bacterium]|nr:PD-(D/E)XK nuclease family protein [Oscillospiraceae bacterium]
LVRNKCDSVVFENMTISDDVSVDKAPKINASVDMSLLDKLYNSISFEEENTQSDTVAKLSVTEFVREIHEGMAEKQITYFPPLPYVTDEDRKATAAEKVTDTHLFMELCDFEKASENAKAELEALVNQNKMTKEQADNVDIKTVESFFESEIYNLCKASDEVLREKQFKVRLSDMKLKDTPLDAYKDKDVLVQGIADLIVKSNNGYAIVDYKTDNVKYDEELVERHSLQLFLYKKAFELIFDEKICDCYIYSFKLRRPVKVDFKNLQILHKNP